jgi:hypothetical protein
LLACVQELQAIAIAENHFSHGRVARDGVLDRPQ